MIYYRPGRAFSQPAQKLAEILKLPTITTKNYNNIDGRNLILINNFMIELHDWNYPFHKKYYPELNPEKVIKLQFDPSVEYPSNYCPYRYIGFDTNLLESMIYKTTNERNEIIWAGNAKRANREKTLSTIPNLIRFENLSILEYYKTASTFKYGISLPGNGNLCHREVEYMALGVVPIMPPLINKIIPAFLPWENFIPINEIKMSDAIYHHIAHNNRKMFLENYTNQKWAEGIIDILNL